MNQHWNFVINFSDATLVTLHTNVAMFWCIGDRPKPNMLFILPIIQF